MSLVPVYSHKPLLRLPRPDRILAQLPIRKPQTAQDMQWIQDILANYKLTLSGPVTRNGKLSRSNNWVLETSGGKKILKRYNEEINRDQVVHEHSILERLAQIDFPAPRLTAASPEQMIFEREGRYYALFDFLDGYFQYHNHIFFPGQSSVFLLAAGKALAALHGALGDFAPAGKNPNGFTSLEGLRWREPEWYSEKLDTCRRDARKLQAAAAHPVNEALLNCSAALEKRLAQLDRALKQADPARVIIHGDYGPYNLLFKDNCPVVILDFELARLDWRLTDLCNSMTTFARSRMGFQLNKMKLFLDAYRSVSPVSEAEMDCLPLVWEFLSIRRAIVYWRHYLDKGAEKWMAAAHGRLQTVDWINKHPDVFSQLKS